MLKFIGWALLSILLHSSTRVSVYAYFNDECCFEQWKAAISGVEDAYKTAAAKNFSTPEFRKYFTEFLNLSRIYTRGIPIGQCETSLNYKCNERTSRCECRNDGPGLTFVEHKVHRSCAGVENSYCLTFPEEAGKYDRVPCIQGYLCKTHASGLLGHCERNPDEELARDPTIESTEEQVSKVKFNKSQKVAKLRNDLSNCQRINKNIPFGGKCDPGAFLKKRAELADKSLTDYEFNEEIFPLLCLLPSSCMFDNTTCTCADLKDGQFVPATCKHNTDFDKYKGSDCQEELKKYTEESGELEKLRNVECIIKISEEQLDDCLENYNIDYDAPCDDAKKTRLMRKLDVTTKDSLIKLNLANRIELAKLSCPSNTQCNKVDKICVCNECVKIPKNPNPACGDILDEQKTKINEYNDIYRPKNMDPVSTGKPEGTGSGTGGDTGTGTGTGGEGDSLASSVQQFGFLIGFGIFVAIVMDGNRLY